jgi:hypothetical protein
MKNTNLRRIAAVITCASLIAGCATSPDKVSASYVSPMQYGSYDCDQIRGEMIRVSSRVKEVAGAQQRQARNDQIAVGVGLVLFWPALFFLMSDDQKEELARMKGEYDALESAAIQKKCPVAEEIQAAKAETKPS